MNKSESLANLAAALCKTQGEMESARKDSENPYFKSKYSDLASVYDACRGPLAANGLSVVQMPVLDPDGRVGLSTLILHSSGEWLECPVMSMKPVKDTPQELGSCLTYLRRYCLSATVGISSEVDDDGNSASGKTDKPVSVAPVTFRKPAAAEKPPDADPKPAEPAKAKKQEPESEFLPVDKQKWLAIKFKEALPEKYQSGPIADQLRKGWLATEGYKKPDGEGSSSMVPTKDLKKVHDGLIAFAKKQDVTEDDVPF